MPFSLSFGGECHLSSQASSAGEYLSWSQPCDRVWVPEQVLQPPSWETDLCWWRGGWGRGRRNSSYFQEALNGHTSIRHAQKLYWNSKTFPQKLFIIAWRHALTKIHLQKAGKVLLCASFHEPFLIYILHNTESCNQKGHQELLDFFFPVLTLPHTADYFLFKLFLC